MLIECAAIFVCLAASAVSSQSNSAIESININHLICNDDVCTTADNSTASYLFSYLVCIGQYNTEYSDRRCNFTNLPRRSYRSCALKEVGVFCTEILNRDSQVPPACDLSVSTCTSDCRAALLAEFGCCLSIDFSSTDSVGQIHPELVRLWSLCAFDVSESCQLAIPQLPESVPIAQCENRGSSIPYIFEGMCETNVRYTREFVNKAVGNTCSNLKLLALQPFFYCEDSDNLGYCALVQDPMFGSLSSSIRDHCSISSDCTSECRESLIRAKETFGCCSNSIVYYSGRDTFAERLHSCEGDRDIWSYCGIPQSDFCSNSLVQNSNASFTDARFRLYLIFAIILIVLHF